MSKDEEGFSVDRSTSWKKAESDSLNKMSQLIKSVENLNQGMGKFQQLMTGITQAQTTLGGGSGNQLLKEQLGELRKILMVMQKDALKEHVSYMSEKAGQVGLKRHGLGLGGQLKQSLQPLTKVFDKISDPLKQIGNRVSSGLKKSGMMPLLGMAGAGILAGVMGKVIS